MLSREQLKNYRELRHVSMRQLAKYCDLSLAMISYLESGERQLTKKNHDELIKGINAAYQARKIKQKTDKAVKEDKEEVQESTEEKATIKEDKEEIKTKEKETKKTKELGKLKEAREKLTRRSKSENKQ